MNVAVKSAEKPKGEHKTPQVIKKIGVIGAGQMGTGIAHVIALGGYTVALNDLKKEKVDESVHTIEKFLKRQAEKGLITEDDVKPALKRISYAPNFESFADCDLVIEAATEDESIKRKIFAEVCPHLKERALLATNTSSISITRLASTTDRPEHFIGMHFMNPVPLMELVELIRGIATDDDMFAVTRKFVESLNKKVYTLYEGVGTVEAIDKAMKLGAHHPMGPLELADFIGLDTCLSVMQVLYEGLSDSKYRPCPLLVKYVEAGWLGRKTQRGFYDYRGEKPVPTR
jgi:3-hydroxybutyryl-CoA dehydrogenase